MDDAQNIAKRAMSLIHTGKIRRHMLRGSGPIHTGTMEQEEMQKYRGFLMSKNGCMVCALTGKE